MGDLLADHKPDIEEMIRCALREVHMRESVYPRWVAAGRLKQHVADNEIKVMRAIIDTLERVKERGGV